MQFQLINPYKPKIKEVGKKIAYDDDMESH